MIPVIHASSLVQSDHTISALMCMLGVCMYAHMLRNQSEKERKQTTKINKIYGEKKIYKKKVRCYW